MIRPVAAVVSVVEARFTTRQLAGAVLALSACLLLTQAFFVWYFGNVGLSMGAVAYNDDERTVVVDADELRQFERQYDSDVEEGWCLYGSSNETHVRIESVVHARPLDQRSGHVTFTCIPETLGRVAALNRPDLLGAVHSHPDFNRSWLSRKDVMLWGRVSPVIEVMGVYTDRDGPEFFTIESMTAPLEKRVIEADGDSRLVTPDRNRTRR
jgi:proteasome lid subunit RPN8/RPN11